MRILSILNLYHYPDGEVFARLLALTSDDMMVVAAVVVVVLNT